MWKIMIVLMFFLAGCPPLNADAVKACKEACGDKGVDSVNGGSCYCNMRTK